MKTDQITRVQQKSMHLYFRQLAKELNDGGYNVPIVLRESVDGDWNEILIKEIIWRGVQKKLIGKDSTKDITKQELDNIFETINRYIGEKFGVHVPFPSEENKYYANYENYEN